VVAPDATALEIAALTAAHRTPLVAVTVDGEKQAALLGGVTVSTLPGEVLPLDSTR
jgi:hypothetical protein